jgi:hypothetical protein
MREKPGSGPAPAVPVLPRTENLLDGSLVPGYSQPMKVAKRPVPRRRTLNQTQSFNLSTAKTYLGRLIDKASKGEPVYIVRGQHRFILQRMPDIEPIPVRPPGFFANCYTAEEIALGNRLSKASVIRAPEDLE